MDQKIEKFEEEKQANATTVYQIQENNQQQQQQLGLDVNVFEGEAEEQQQQQAAAANNADWNCDYCTNQIQQTKPEQVEDSEIVEIVEQDDAVMIPKQVTRVFKRAIVNPLKERISIAPMVDVTDSNYRFFMRMLTKHAFLYTEMINEHAIMHIERTGNQKLLNFTENQHPVVCQIGGQDPIKCAQAAKIVEQWGYDEVNLNCGCPSQKTIQGCFGAQLMYTPELVADICQEMIQTVNIPVTVKCRLGVDDVDKWENIMNFITVVSERGGVNKFIIHARKAFLKGLDPKQNRTIPPLKYDWVLQLKKEFPHLEFLINGGFTDTQAMHDILKPENNLTGCMVGRMAMNTTWEIAKLDREFFSHDHIIEDTMNREQMLLAYADYAQKESDFEIARVGRCSNTIMIRPIINMFVGEYRGAEFKKKINQMASGKQYKGRVRDLIVDALDYYKEQNPEALLTLNGEKVIRPSWMLEAIEKDRLKFEMEKEQKLKQQQAELESQQKQLNEQQQPPQQM